MGRERDTADITTIIKLFKESLMYQVQILAESVFISLFANTFKKGIYPYILSSTTNRIVGQTRLFSNGRATPLREGKTLKTVHIFK